MSASVGEGEGCIKDCTFTPFGWLSPFSSLKMACALAGLLWRLTLSAMEMI